MLKGRELSDNKFQLDSLDGLRGMAALMVLLSHTSNAGIFFLPFANFSGIGKSGVFLFFILSSFLLSYPFIKKGKDACNKDFLLGYFVRRFFRIYPLYFCYLLLALISSLVLCKLLHANSVIGIPFALSLNEFIEHILLIRGKGVTWSILVEFRFYFVLPVLALIYSVLFKNKLLPSIVLTLILILVSQSFWPQSESLVNDSRLEFYLPIFFMGSLLAVIYHNWQGSYLINNKKVRLAIEIAGLIAIVMLIIMIPSVSSYVLGKSIPLDYYHKQFMLFGFLWSIVLFACIAGIGILRRFFEARFLRYLGFISFSMYLLHIIPLFVLKKLGLTLFMQLPIVGWMILAITIATSHLTWTFIEKPTSKIRYSKSARFRLTFNKA